MGLNAFNKMFYIELMKFVKFALYARRILKKRALFMKKYPLYRKTHMANIKKLNLWYRLL